MASFFCIFEYDALLYNHIIDHPDFDMSAGFFGRGFNQGPQTGLPNLVKATCEDDKAVDV